MSSLFIDPSISDVLSEDVEKWKGIWTLRTVGLSVYQSVGMLIGLCKVCPYHQNSKLYAYRTHSDIFVSHIGYSGI